MVNFLLGNIVMILIIAAVIFICWDAIKIYLLKNPLLGGLSKVFSFFSKSKKEKEIVADGIKAFHDLLEYQLLNGTDEQVKRVADLALDVRPKPPTAE